MPPTHLHPPRLTTTLLASATRRASRATRATRRRRRAPSRRMARTRARTRASPSAAPPRAPTRRTRSAAASRGRGTRAAPTATRAAARATTTSASPPAAAASAAPTASAAAACCWAGGTPEASGRATRIPRARRRRASSALRTTAHARCRRSDAHPQPLRGGGGTQLQRPCGMSRSDPCRHWMVAFDCGTDHAACATRKLPKTAINDSVTA
eukprot:7251368-Prymnesium_polylepis.1